MFKKLKDLGEKIYTIVIGLITLVIIPVTVLFISIRELFNTSIRSEDIGALACIVFIGRCILDLHDALKG